MRPKRSPSASRSAAVRSSNLLVRKNSSNTGQTNPDIGIQGRTASAVGTGILLWNNKKDSGIYQYAPNKGELEPLCDEIPADGVVFARNKNIPGSLIVFRTQEEKLRNPEVLRHCN